MMTTNKGSPVPRIKHSAMIFPKATGSDDDELLLGSEPEAEIFRFHSLSCATTKLNHANRRISIFA
jgi:hypothetical protein